MRNPFPYQRKTFLVSLLSLAIFSLTALSRSDFSKIDTEVNIWATSIQAYSFTAVAEIIDYIFDTSTMLLISLSMAVYLFYKNQRENGLLLIGAMLLNAVMTETIKTLIQSARPPNGLIIATGFSFPSGHASGSIVFCGLLAYFGWQYKRSSGVKTLMSILFVAITIAVGFDRIYLNVHWLSDVLGGYLLGTFCLTFSISMFQYLKIITINQTKEVTGGTLHARRVHLCEKLGSPRPRPRNRSIRSTEPAPRRNHKRVVMIDLASEQAELNLARERIGSPKLVNACTELP